MSDGVFGSIAGWDVPAFLEELEARWTASNKHFNDVQADLVLSLESEKVLTWPTLSMRMIAPTAAK